MSLDQVRSIADAVLYEGYLLYPYRASSHKNRSRWQFGVLGPPHATAASFGEEPEMETQCLLAPHDGPAAVTVHLRFLQLQVREVLSTGEDGVEVPVGQLIVDGVPVMSWDEAVEREIVLPALPLGEVTDAVHEVPGGEETEPLTDARGVVAGRIVRRRLPLTVRVRARAVIDDGYVRLSVAVRNEHPEPAATKDAAIRSSLIGAHLLLRAHDAEFVSLLEPPAGAAAAAGRCRQRRCWPVLAGPKGTTDTLLGAPIILYDYPEVAEQSPGALFDSTEIDEILTLRVMTMTEEEKAEARATDPRAREIIDRCDGMSPAGLQQLHGLLRDPHRPQPAAPAGPVADVRDVEPAAFDTAGAPWWDPAADASVRPGSDAVVIDGVRVAKGSLVRVHPSRRADAQDLFFAGQVARVTAVLSDVDGGTHIALVLVDDPASDLHDWYGRYFYFAPDELTPLSVEETAQHREENRS
ncbi:MULTISPECIES: hypothetical protein [unclassified Streptomyces]|uniref:hypothetical protein n=1 Tax=unclassified Streptomyces TaxID=2593676 RepID=UPI000F5C1F35|nr:MULTISPECIES: hypothetical protein [unclassified Streptomyces]WSG49277.1 hypothetical protein OHA38_05440 [Streptomyces sp. NBC_01732]WSW99930.1 hypothetical protein OG355_05565 [Streptomyces sp. NBC_00987]MCX5099002.1 hypothetical protein [Streptomyces sp. NBC_00439]RPK69857.1 hypothetical protein EES42_17790 [Streptomyces sp. ADI95-17]WSP50616.1 hypothetical protein OG348_34785 [Streptomyces sp. NBC_01243]